MSPPGNDSSGSSRLTPLVLLEPPPQQPLPPLGTRERLEAKYPALERRKQQNIHDAKIEAFKSAHADELARQDQYCGELKSTSETALSTLKEQHVSAVSSLCAEQNIRVTELKKEYAAATEVKDNIIMAKEAEIAELRLFITRLQDDKTSALQNAAGANQEVADFKLLAVLTVIVVVLFFLR